MSIFALNLGNHSVLLYTIKYNLIKVTCEVTKILWYNPWHRAVCPYHLLWNYHDGTFPMQIPILYHFPLQYHNKRLFF